MEAEPLAQGDGVRRELNRGPVTCCPQRMEGLLRGGKDVHRFGVQKHSLSRQNAQGLCVDSDTPVDLPG